MTWHDDFQVWLTEEQSLENAQKVVDHFYKTGSDWTKESISAMVGNMRHESSINPNMYEYGYDWNDDRGYGLVQWTPRSKYWDWALSEGLDPEVGESQLSRIDYEVDNNIQWISNRLSISPPYPPGLSSYNGSFADFRKNVDGLTLDELTEAFMWDYEGPAYEAATSSLPDRQAFAHRAFEELNWEGGGGDPSPNPDPNFEEIIRQVNSIVDEGETIIKDGIISVLDSVELPSFEEIFEAPLFRNSEKFYSNNLMKGTFTYNNMLKINPTSNSNFDFDLNELGQAIDGVIDDGFSFIRTEIGKIDYENGGGNPDPTSDMYFPVDFTANGINFWYPPYDNDLTHNMDFGTRTNGDFHAGYDVGGGGLNHAIYAVSTGEVIDVREAGSWGQIIVINHSNDEYYSLYAHLVVGSQKVSVGDMVEAGTEIGTMGASGGNYAIHLHYELSTSERFSDNGDVVDPKPYLQVVGNNQTNLPNPVR